MSNIWIFCFFPKENAGAYVDKKNKRFTEIQNCFFLKDDAGTYVDKKNKRLTETQIREVKLGLMRSKTGREFLKKYNLQVTSVVCVVAQSSQRVSSIGTQT